MITDACNQDAGHGLPCPIFPEPDAVLPVVRAQPVALSNLRASADDGDGDGSGNDDDVRGTDGDDPTTGTIVKTRPKTKKPSMYKVLMLNDDYTPMEFVVHVLEAFFNKNREEATQVMLHVHKRGVGVCGVFTYEIAETKVTQVMDFARRHQHPLQCIMEKE